MYFSKLNQRVAGFAALSMTFLAATSGCSANTSNLPPTPQQNISLWTQPLDPYLEIAHNSDLSSYIRVVMTNNCLNDAGFKTPPVPSKMLDVNPALIPRLTLESAREKGYTAFNPDNALHTEWDHFYTAADQMLASNPAADEQAEVCAKEVNNTLPTLDPEVQYYANNAKNQSTERALRDPEVVRTTKVWATCLRKSGYKPAEYPSSMPPSEISESWPEGQISSEEYAMAIADATCREESGYQEAMYQAEWQHQMEFINQNKSALAKNYDELKKHRKELEELLTKTSPKQ